MLRAILNGKPSKVKHFLKEGSSATARWHHVRPYILIAAGMATCNPRVLELLIRHGASPNGKRIAYYVRLNVPLLAYYMPLAAAASGGSLACVKTLLQHGAKPNLTNTQGLTPLKAAVASKYCSPAMLKLLIKGGANPNFVPGFNDLPSSVIQAKLSTYGAGPEKYELLKKTTLILRRSPLATAAAYDHPACARALIEHGANVNAVMPKSGGTALMWAVYAGRSAAVTALLLNLHYSWGIASDCGIRSKPGAGLERKA